MFDALAPATWRPPAALRRAPEALRGIDPQLQLVVIDLRDLDEATLRQKLERPLSSLTLLLLQHLPQRDRQAAAAALLPWGDLLTAVEMSPRGALAMEAITSYVLCVTELEAGKLGMLVARILEKPTGSYVMSTANKLRAEGRSEAMVEALAKAQDRLLRQLAARFGRLPADLETRVRCGSSTDIDDWSIRFVRASSVHEVFSAG